MTEGGQTLEQVAQRGCRFSIVRDIQNPTGNSPQPTAPIDLALIGGMGLDNSQNAPSNIHSPVRLIHWILFYNIYHKTGNRSYKTFIKSYRIKYEMKQGWSLTTPGITLGGGSKEGRGSWPITWNFARVWTDCLERQEGPADRIDRLATVFLALSYHS